MHRIVFYSLVMFLLQGIYLMIGALWPLLHLESFLNFTHLQTDTWLMRMTGVFMLSAGACLLLTYYIQKYSVPINFMAVSICLGSIYMDAYYYFIAELPLRVYLFDFVVNALFAVSWLTILFRYYNWKMNVRAAENKKLKI